MTTSVVVRYKDGSVRPFSRDRLFLSVLKAVGHRETAVDDAGALTSTIMAKLHPKLANATLTPSEIIKITLETLQRFDHAASIQYAAYHRL